MVGHRLQEPLHGPGAQHSQVLELSLMQLPDAICKGGSQAPLLVEHNRERPGIVFVCLALLCMVPASVSAMTTPASVMPSARPWDSCNIFPSKSSPIV